MKKQLIKKGYPETMVNEEIQKATNQDRTGLLNKEKTETGNHLTLCVTYNKTLPNIKTILEKHWHILNVNPELKKVFENKPLLALCKNKNLRQLIGGNTIGECSKKQPVKGISSYTYWNANFVKSSMLEKLKQSSIYD